MNLPSNTKAPESLEQVMSAQGQRAAPTANGRMDGLQEESGAATSSSGPGPSVGGIEERQRSDQDVGDRAAAVIQAAEANQSPSTSDRPPGVALFSQGNESRQQQERPQEPATTAPVDGRPGSRMPDGGTRGAVSANDFLTPRSMVSAPVGQPGWLTGMEVPRWVSRLGSYLNVGHGELFPSPLAGSSPVPSPPGGQAFRLRSPTRVYTRQPPPQTPPSSSDVGAEAIQAEVQRQLGSLLDRLQLAEESNSTLRAQLDLAQQSLEQARAMGARPSEVTTRQPEQRGAMDTAVHAMQQEWQGDPLSLPGAQTLPGQSTVLQGDPLGLLQGGCNAEQSVPRMSEQFSSAQQGSMAFTFGGEPSLQRPPDPQPIAPPPQPEPRGFLRSILGNPRQRSESPVPSKAVGAQAPESPMMDALVRGVQQLQELQAVALAKGQSAGSDLVKPGTTSLNPLPEVTNGADTALLFQDWLEVTSAAMNDISDNSAVWWREVTGVVDQAYQRWLASTPLERLGIQPKGEELSQGRWTRLNARVSTMVLNAMTSEQRVDMISHRISTSTVRMLFRLHTMFEPGGSNERQDVLKRLQNPLEFAATDNLEGVLGVLRAWPRWMARCEAVRMSPPDASVLARGLKLLTSRYIEAAPDANFRTAMLRTSLRLDGQPTMDNVYAYQRHLQAEVETLIASQPRAAPAAEQPRLRALDKPQSPKGKDKDKEKDKDKSTADLCRYFMKPSGCKRGSRCAYSHSMATLDRETRNKKCLLCGSEGHRRRECTVGQNTPKAGATTLQPQRGQRAIADKEPTAGVSTLSTVATAGSMDTASTASSSVQGTPWTLEALVQAAQQVVATQGASVRQDSSPEKTKPEVRTLVVKDIRISSMTTTSALLDSGATHSLRSARDMEEWEQASEVMVQLAGNNALTMRMSDTGSLLMPPRSTPSTSEAPSSQGQTIVPLGELVKTLGYTLVWSPSKCFLETSTGERLPLSTKGGCPQLCEAEALSLIARLEDRKRELLENSTAATMDRVSMAAMQMERGWKSNLQEYVGTGSMEAGYRSVRDAAFLQDLPGECLDGLIQPSIKEDGWKIMKAVDFLTRPQKRRLWTARRWVIHLFAGSPGHWQVFQLDQGSTVVLELDVHRCGGHDILSSPTWRLLLWGAITGRIDAVIGGPPGRGGLTGTKALRAITRMLWLYSVADVARGESKLNQKRPVAFMLEHPSQDSTRRESLWTTQMWKQFEEEMDVAQVTFNPAAMGGQTGSTTIGTNICYLMGLQELGVEGVEAESSHRDCTSPVWPPGFVDALVKALQFWDRRPICTPMLAKMSAEQWRKHVQSNHADYHRDCLTCVMAKGRGRRHARVHHPDMFTLTIDLAGPVKPGLDVSSKGALGKNLKYLLVARYVLPTEYVKGYTGVEPPEDHGLNKQGLKDESSAGQELARPSPLPPHDEGVLG